MTFLQLLDGVEILYQSGNAVVSGMQYDSRRVQRGDLFVAVRGATTEGSHYVDKAIENGATAVVTDCDQKPWPSVAWAQVRHGRRALARISANFYQHPAEKLAIVGITGTNGKTTTAFLVESILNAARRRTALVGTIEYHVADRILLAPHTTPESLELNQLFREALDANVTDAVMEVSSHALEQQRVYGIPFDVAVFTNLTRDHLDYHHTMEQYFAAKRCLFEGCGTAAPRVSVLNIEDEYGVRLAKASKSVETITFGIKNGDFHPEKLQMEHGGSRFELVFAHEKVPTFIPLLGRVNVYNTLAAAAAAYARGCAMELIARGIEALKNVPGRFERVDCGQPFCVVVDYAHTSDALRNLTALARSLVGKHRVITVFGCGGDRDCSKRPLMGEAAGRGSDFVVLTSDNPRSEDPNAIIEDTRPGLERSGTRYKIEPDRKQAIGIAISEAKIGDIVLIAGKGHEKVQVTREGSIAFDDVKIAREALAALGYAHAIAGTAKRV